MRTLIFLIALSFSLTNAGQDKGKAPLKDIISDLEKISISFSSTSPTLRMTCKCHLQAMKLLKELLQNRAQDGESAENKTLAVKIIWNLEVLKLPTEVHKICIVERRKRKTNPTSGTMLRHYLQHLREFYKSQKCTFKEAA